MAAKQDKQVKSYEDQVNEINAEIKALTDRRKELAILMANEISNAVEMPLHQLNAIANVGYEDAKKQFGDKWVE